MISKKKRESIPAPKNVKYISADKESISQLIARKFPRELIPTKRIDTIFGLVFIFVLLISAAQFPFGTLISGKSDVVIGIGFPLHFLEFNALTSGDSPTLPINLLIDLLLYLIAAYIIDISLNLIISNPLLRSGENIKKRPIVFKNRNPTIAEKVTEKVAKKL